MSVLPADDALRARLPLLLLVILLQQGKGGDMASAFGGGSSQTAFGARARRDGADEGDHGVRRAVHAGRAGAGDYRSARAGLVMAAHAAPPAAIRAGASTPKPAYIGTRRYRLRLRHRRPAPGKASRGASEHSGRATGEVPPRPVSPSSPRHWRLSHRVADRR